MKLAEWKKNLHKNEAGVINALAGTNDATKVGTIVAITEVTLRNIDGFVGRHDEWTDEEWEEAKTLAEASILRVNIACRTRLEELKAS